MTAAISADHGEDSTTFVHQLKCYCTSAFLCTGPYLRGGGVSGINPPPPKNFDMNFFSTHLFGISGCVVLLHSPVSVIAFSMIFSQYLVIFMIICANY